ncbi:TonB-dependent receptor domain-containing protein [Sphingomonas immobilis]|uniref:TonB-dependent receptor n=1 Tax=Sphingomonas immobilis TaxID=3063997 RepID=A0ABT8ZVH3_9SPHN|nr:TonB-dependent receptor [Sphingomonas sp. CA1-15]MDO7841574.1 TonB-dependent receptor [Sphingomonas sp. CA1-15]
MTKSTIFAGKSRLLMTAAPFALVLGAAPAFAQDTAPAAPLPADTTEAPTKDIVVTGTLIRNPNLTASSPVSVIGKDELTLRQTNTADQVLRDLPGAVPSIGSAVNNGNNGASYADLRGLGNFRNVVLLDGIRVTPSTNVGRVDLNNVPLALVERVDTLTGGAATTYGADAVSGVINFITRKDFSGIEVAVSNQITGEGDGHYFRGDVTIGHNFADGRGNIVLSGGYQKSDPVYQGARRISQNNYTSTTGARGGSGTTVPGRFTLGSNFNTIQPGNGTLRPYVGSRDGFNFNPYNVFQTPFERFNVYGAGNYEVTDNVEIYGRGMWSQNTVDTIIAPSGVFGQLLTIPVSNPYLPANARNQFCANNDFDPNTAGIQTLTQAQCDAAATATNPNDPNFRSFTTTVGRRTTEVGPRLSNFVTKFFDFHGGAKITLSPSMTLDLSGSYGESSNVQRQSGYVLISRLRSAVYATNTTSCLSASPVVPNPNPALPPLAAAGASITAGSGCVPVNIFGADGSILPNQVPYLTASAFTEQQTSLAQARALLTGDLGVTSPWADQPIGFAVGAEYRKYTARQIADILSQTAGELGGAGGAVPNYSGSYDVKEVYGEAIIPLAAGKPFFESLTLELGARYSAYKIQTAGDPGYDTFTWKANTTWEPVDGVKFRGGFQRAVRAPNIAELFAPINTGLTNLSQDPCSGSRPVGNAALTAVCIAQGAPLASIGSIANPTAAQANVTTAGGTYLRPETSYSYNFGVVLQPKWVPGLSFTVDYYNIKVKNAISQPGPGDLVAACFGNNAGAAANVNKAACALFGRNPVTGALDGDPATTKGLILPSSNSGRITTDGIDFGVNYRHDFGWTKLALSFIGNYTLSSAFQAIVPGSIIPPGYPGAGGPIAAVDNRECIGLYGQNCGSPGSAGPSSSPGSLQPQFSFSQRTTFTFGPADLSLLWRHISPMDVEPGVTTFSGTIGSGALAGEVVNFGHINAYDYFDLSTRVSVAKNFQFTFTVMNLFDRQPPIVGGTVGSTSFNSGNTYPSTYDALGRRFAVGATVKF